MSLGVLERPVAEPKTGQGEGHVTHIVKSPDDRPGTAVVLEARIYGMEVEALCGHRWVPSRDSKQYPICQACKEVWDQAFPPDQSPEHG